MTGWVPKVDSIRVLAGCRTSDAEANTAEPHPSACVAVVLCVYRGLCAQPKWAYTYRRRLTLLGSN